MKVAQVGQSLVILVAMLSSGCAMETADADANDEVVATESNSFQGEVSQRGGPRCAPVIAKDAAGNLYVKELLCPLPAKQLPDPEMQIFENQHDWVAGGGDTENNVY